MGGAMDLVSGGRKVVVAMRRSAKGKANIVKEFSLPLMSKHSVNLVVAEPAIIAFPNGQATPIETGSGISVIPVIAATKGRTRRAHQCPWNATMSRGSKLENNSAPSWQVGGGTS
jgi:acetate CoA/acetoacetate CoA-transferase beta subunit